MEHSRPLIAAFWMSGAVASFLLMAVAGREITVELDTFELMFYRSVIGFIIVCAVISVQKKGFAHIRTTHFPSHIKRNIFHFTGQNLWFFGITMIPLSQLVALEFTNPIWVALLAPLMLGEKMTGWRMISAIFGFLGVLIVAQPGVTPLNIGHAAALGAAVGFALNTIFTRQIMHFDTVLCVLFWMTLMQAGFGLVLSLPGGITVPSGAILPWIAVVGACGLSAHYCLTSALGNAPATIVAPMDFMRLPLVALIGKLLYDEQLMMAVFIGGGFIIIANMINILSERNRSRVVVQDVFK